MVRSKNQVKIYDSEKVKWVAIEEIKAVWFYRDLMVQLVKFILANSNLKNQNSQKPMTQSWNGQMVFVA